MKNYTTPEAADTARAQYRAKCTTRRNGHIVEERQGDEWVKIDLSSRFGKLRLFEGPGVNRAKRYIRENNLKSYNV